MNYKEIIIEVNPERRFLAGEIRAKEIFDEQVKNELKNLKLFDGLIIVYPSHVSGISITFTKKMYNEIHKRLGDDAYLVQFKAGSEYLANKIREDIIF